MENTKVAMGYEFKGDDDMLDYFPHRRVSRELMSNSKAGDRVFWRKVLDCRKAYREAKNEN